MTMIIFVDSEYKNNRNVLCLFLSLFVVVVVDNDDDGDDGDDDDDDNNDDDGGDGVYSF